MRKGKEDG